MYSLLSSRLSSKPAVAFCSLASCGRRSDRRDRKAGSWDREKFVLVVRVCPLEPEIDRLNALADAVEVRKEKSGCGLCCDCEFSERLGGVSKPLICSMITSFRDLSASR